MTSRKYPEELTERAAEMRESGATLAQIALRLDMSIGAVEYHCLRLGADSPKPMPPMPVGPMKVMRGGHVLRRFTPEEDRVLIQMDTAGALQCEMAAALGRPHNSVKARLMALARAEARAERAEGIE